MKPSCKAHPKCTGCPSIAIPYEQQLRAKENYLRQTISSALKLPPAMFKKIVASPQVAGFRSTAKLCLNQSPSRGRTIGLYMAGTKTVIDIPRCPVHDPKINIIAAMLKDPRICRIAFYDHKRAYQPGVLKFVTIRVNPNSKNFGVVISHTGAAKAELKHLGDELAKAGGSVYETEICKKDESAVWGGTISHLSGAETFLFSIGSLSIELPPTAFFQTNFSLVKDFVKYVTSAVHGAELLLDLYGGFGAYSLFAQKEIKRGVVVDTNEDAVEALNIWAKEKNLPIKGEASTCEAYLAKAKDLAKVTHIIANPPRAGFSPKLRSQLCGSMLSNAKSLTYVSCNPKALARDLKALCRGGPWRVAAIKPFDMFPHTEHVEAVVFLRKD